MFLRIVEQASKMGTLPSSSSLSSLWSRKVVGLDKSWVGDDVVSFFSVVFGALGDFFDVGEFLEMLVSASDFSVRGVFFLLAVLGGDDLFVMVGYGSARGPEVRRAALGIEYDEFRFDDNILELWAEEQSTTRDRG